MKTFLAIEEKINKDRIFEGLENQFQNNFSF